VRIRSLAAAATLAAGLASPAADAGTLASATWTQSFPGVAITVTNSGATCTESPAHVPGAGFLICPTAGLQATGASTGAAYNVSLTMPLFQMQAFTTGGLLNFGTLVTLSGAQDIAGNASSATATPGIAGNVVVDGALHTMGSMWSQLFGVSLVRYPLRVGIGAESIQDWRYYSRFDFYAWTPGTVSITGLYSGGLAQPDLVAMGSFDLTAGGAGTVTLVAPTKVFVLNPPLSYRIANLATLKLTFVPEPSALLLLGASALALLRFVRRN
jgi:hypothetical protein